MRSMNAGQFFILCFDLDLLVWCSDLQLLQARAKDKAGDEAKAEGKKTVPKRKSATDLVRGLRRKSKSKANLKDEDPHSEETPLIPPVPAVPEPAGKESTKPAVKSTKVPPVPAVPQPAVKQPTKVSNSLYSRQRFQS